MTEDRTDLVDTVAAGLAVQVPASTIRTWASRFPDDLPKRGKDSRGRSLYSLTDVRLVHQKLTSRRTNGERGLRH